MGFEQLITEPLRPHIQAVAGRQEHEEIAGRSTSEMPKRSLCRGINHGNKLRRGSASLSWLNTHS